MYSYLYNITAAAAIIGALSALMAFAANTLMTYGHIFWRLRFNAAKRAAKKSGNPDFLELIGDLDDMIKENKSVDEIAESSNDSFWMIADFRPQFRPWVCLVCLSLRFSLISCLVFSLGLVISNNLWELANLPVLILASSAICHFLISRL